jgi:hypothetical protein
MKEVWERAGKERKEGGREDGREIGGKNEGKIQLHTYFSIFFSK